MRKLNLAPYLVRGGVNPATGEDVFQQYNVKRTIGTIMMASGEATTQRLSMGELLKRYDVARKIADCENDSIIIEEAEYALVRAGFEAFRGYSQNEVELCRRINEADEVEVTEKE